LVEEDYLTLLDVAMGVPVYPGEPRAWALSQVDAFRRSPDTINVHCSPTEILDEEDSVHIVNSNKALRRILEAPRELPEELPGFVNLMLMLGCGLGYQIEALFEHTEIRNLCIIEPEPDIFYASLLTIDWVPVLDHFSQKGRSLELLVGEDQAACYQALDTWFSEIAGFNVVQPYIFQHLVGPKTAEAYAAFPDRIMPSRTHFLSFFDDEQRGSTRPSGTSRRVFPCFSETPGDPPTGGQPSLPGTALPSPLRSSAFASSVSKSSSFRVARRPAH